MAHTGDELLTIGEVAEKWKVNPATVRRWIAEERLPVAATLPGGQFRIRLRDLDALLAGRRAR